MIENSNYSAYLEIENTPKAIPIPDRYRLELLADWRGYGREDKSETDAQRYLRLRAGIIMHPETRQWIEERLGIAK